MVKKKDAAMDDLISQKDAAELRGVSKSAISDLIKRGRLQTVIVAGRPLLRRSEVEAFEPQQGWPKGKPRKDN